MDIFRVSLSFSEKRSIELELSSCRVLSTYRRATWRFVERCINYYFFVYFTHFRIVKNTFYQIYNNFVANIFFRMTFTFYMNQAESSLYPDKKS